MALFKTINSIDDFDELGNVLSNTLGINLQLDKDISNSENIVEDLWNISLEKCNLFLNLNEMLSTIKLALYPASTGMIDDDFLQIIKKHVVFSAYYTLSCISNKNTENDEYKNIYEYKYKYLYKILMGENIGSIDVLETFKKRINRTFEALTEEAECKYFKNILGISSKFELNCIDSSAFDLLAYIIEWWTFCPYNPKFQKSKTYRCYDFLKFENALIRYKVLSKKDPIKLYILERSFNFSFIHELADVIQLFQKDANNEFYIIPKDKYGIYLSERYKKPKNIFGEEILINRIDRQVFNIRWKDEIWTPSQHASEKRDVCIQKYNIEEFCETLSCFATLPNVYTRKKFIYFAVNMYYNIFEENFDNWKREILLFVDQLTILTFPAFERCFLYLLLQNADDNVIDGKCKLEKCQKLLLDYINQCDIIKDIETFFNTNNSNSAINEPTQETLNKKILTTIYHDIMKDVEGNSNLYNLLVVDTELEIEVRNAANTLKA